MKALSCAIFADVRQFPKAGLMILHLVSNGLDLLPTLCDYAGIEAPEGLHGRSLRPLA